MTFFELVNDGGDQETHDEEEEHKGSKGASVGNEPEAECS